MLEDLKIIKDKYGEKMMHLCRELFPTLLEINGLLSEIILENFEPCRYLYNDIIENKKVEMFQNYIYSLIDIDDKQKKEYIHRSPKELLNEAGYDFYECKTEKDIQSFRKYYKKNEEICTFDGGRLNCFYVFFAVKKNIDEIKRENFVKPQRDDEYGTSVISIQFSKNNINRLSIKNRYNHKVENPDATFSNNLDNIILGLTESFEKEYNLHFYHNKQNFDLPGYVKADDGKYYKYNYEINNTYFCPDNIIIKNFEVRKLPKERYIILDYFIIDRKNKTIELYDQNIYDSFVSGIKDIEKIDVTKLKETGNKLITITTPSQNQIIIEIDYLNRIIGYKNKELTYIGSWFMAGSKYLEYLDLPQVTHIRDNFLFRNINLKQINLPNLVKVGDNFLYYNECLERLSLLNLNQTGDGFLKYNEILKLLTAPQLKVVGSQFLFSNVQLKILTLLKLEKIDSDFLCYNKNINYLDLGSLEEESKQFLSEYLQTIISKLSPQKTLVLSNF